MKQYDIRIDSGETPEEFTQEQILQVHLFTILQAAASEYFLYNEELLWKGIKDEWTKMYNNAENGRERQKIKKYAKASMVSLKNRMKQYVAISDSLLSAAEVTPHRALVTDKVMQSIIDALPDMYNKATEEATEELKQIKEETEKYNEE